MKTSTKILLVFLGILLFGIGLTGGFFLGKYLTNKSNKKGEESTATNTDNNKSSTDKKSRSPRDDLNGPYYHQVFSATSTDGLTWQKNNELLFDHASVPGAVLKDGKVYLYFVDANGDEYQLSVGVSTDLGETFTKEKVNFEDMASYDAADPHPELVNGKIVLYFLGSFVSGHGTGGSEEFTIYNAISSDGIHFDDLHQLYQTSEMTTDPDFFQTPTDVRMFVSQGTGMDLLVSSDGDQSFTKDENFLWSKGGVSDTIEIGGIYRTYFCGNGIQSATGGDTGHLTEESGSRITETSKIVCDPSVIELPDESYLMFYKTQEAQKKN